MNAVLSRAVQTHTAAPIVKPWKIDATRGAHNGVLNSQWSSRSDDERFLSLADLHAFVDDLANHSKAETVDVNNIRVQASPDNPTRLALTLDDPTQPVDMTAHSFGQLCSLTQTPASYLRKLPAMLAGINLQHGIREYRGELLKAYTHQQGDAATLRAVTSPSYGRILDRELVRAVMRVTEGTDWKVPGCIDWSTMTYNPHTTITKQSTTLYASDRDVFMFMVDDLHPIEVGTLADGSPDMLFRMFYAWNSEVGDKTFGFAGGYLRGICQNRNLWGVEGFKEFRVKHTKGAPMRFALEAARKLREMTQAEPLRVVEGVKAAKATRIAHDDDDALGFLKARKFSETQSRTILDTVLSEEGHPARNVWDIVQGITAVARTINNADDRVAMEQRAGALLDTVKV